MSSPSSAVAPDSAWIIGDAIDLINTLEEKLSEVGFHLGLTGSVLFNSESSKDVDLIVYPHDSSTYDLKLVYTVLTLMGMKRVCSQAFVKSLWEKQGRIDGKHVEVWQTESGKRLDIFFMR